MFDIELEGEFPRGRQVSFPSELIRDQCDGCGPCSVCVSDSSLNKSVPACSYEVRLPPRLGFHVPHLKQAHPLGSAKSDLNDDFTLQPPAIVHSATSSGAQAQVDDSASPQVVLTAVTETATARISHMEESNKIRSEVFST